MSKHKQNAPKNLDAASTETSSSTEAPRTTSPSSTDERGPGKSPLRFSLLFWGLPLVIFTIIAILKCDQ